MQNLLRMDIRMQYLEFLEVRIKNLIVNTKHIICNDLKVRFVFFFLIGLQNYMAYTQSVIYARSNGGGKASSLAMVIVSSLLFFIGPTIASFIPRCMAGVLLLHVGIDLFLEGIYDSK